MNGEEVATIASVMSENFEPQSKKQRLENVDGEQQMDFETQMSSKSSEGNYIEKCKSIYWLSVLVFSTADSQLIGETINREKIN